MKFNLVIEATDAEIKEFAVDAAHRVGAKLIWEAAHSFGDAMREVPGLSSILAAGFESMKATVSGARVGGTSGPGQSGHAPGCPLGDTPSGIPAPCGTRGPQDTIDSDMWSACSEPSEFVVTAAQFGNRGSVERLCCAKHRDFLTHSCDCSVRRVAPPPPVVTPPPTEH